MSEHDPDRDEDLADEAAEASSDAWETYTERAEESEESEESDEPDGPSVFPDVDLLADHLRSASEALTEGDDEDEPGRGAP